MTGLTPSERHELIGAAERLIDAGQPVDVRQVDHLVDLVDLITLRHVAAALTEAADAIYAEGQRARIAYHAHNAARADGRPPVRSDLNTWANAAEVHARLVRERVP